ncbi:MAG: triose-phosphate isomerase [Deltaproteobacteria bacterium]|nr:triose-phosphate isomerase [Deltaproteobacteria bacterium]
MIVERKSCLYTVLHIRLIVVPWQPHGNARLLNNIVKEEWIASMKRRPLVTAAHKLFLSLSEEIGFAKELIRKTQNEDYDFDIAVCPSFINLAHVTQILRGSKIGVGAQNVDQAENGAFTGQISMQDLQGIGVQLVTVGHSELRAYRVEGHLEEYPRETNETVNAKIKICLKYSVVPIACVGETREDRDNGKSREVIERDVKGMLKDISPDSFRVEDIVIAYEPVWAIKGLKNKDARPASASEANEMHEFIREILTRLYGSNVAAKMRIIYGGSVSSENTEELLKKPSIDGLLIGSASTKIGSFLDILECAQIAVSEKAPSANRVLAQIAD